MTHALEALANLLAASSPGAPAHAHASHGAGHLMRFFFRFGLAGLPVISAVDSSFVPLPVPGVTDVLIVLYAAGHANLVLLVGLATLGSAVGGLLSHAIGGAGGMALLKRYVNTSLLARVTHWMERHAVLSVALPALLPPPMPLSPFVLVAGAVHMSRRTFMTAFTLSRFLRHCIAAWIGVRYGGHVIRLWNHLSAKWGATFLTVLWTVIVAFTAVAVWKLVKVSREMKLAPDAPPIGG